MEFSRRSFLGGAAFAAAGMAAKGSAAAVPEKSGKVKFCVFADIHYTPGVFPNSTKEWLGRIIDHAKAEKCDFIIHCGDFSSAPVRDADYVGYYNGCGLPAYHVIGNHDDDGNTHQETLKAYGMECGHYFFDKNGFRFVIADPNYIRYGDGRIEHYSKGNYFRKNSAAGDVIGIMPPEQIEWLANTVENSPYPCIVFSHQSFERPTGDACNNHKEVLAVFDRVNLKSPGKVRLVINGHHHRDFVRTRNGVVFFDLNSANFDWIGRHAHDKYPKEYIEKHKLRPRKDGKYPFVAWDDPIHAIVTMDADGLLKVEGMESAFSCGVTPESVGVRFDNCGRATTASVQSFEMNMKYN
jgi:predicted phosphodiesterase